MKYITAKELSAWLADETGKPKPVLLDVREPWETNIAKIPDSRAVPLSQFMNQIGSLQADHDTVCICHHGGRSAQVAMYLEHNGFQNVYNLTGGVDAWASQVDPKMARY